jgi:hypothetical protein
MAHVQCMKCSHVFDANMREAQWWCPKCCTPQRQPCTSRRLMDVHFSRPVPFSAFIHPENASPDDVKALEELKESGAHGVYEIGFLGPAGFVPMYLGRAWGRTVHQRLCEHSQKSHVPEICANRDRLHCRWIALPVAKSMESFLFETWDYVWNNRIEWARGGD